VVGLAPCAGADHHSADAVPAIDETVVADVEDLADDERFVSSYVTALTSLHQHGARATLRSLV
jgi:hypothetical protein